MRTADVQVGQRWVERRDGSVPWRVVGLRGRTVSLSGPGPCRSLLYVSVRELTAGWKLVPEPEIPPEAA